MRRYPPVVIATTVEGRIARAFPQVDADDWCAEHLRTTPRTVVFKDQNVSRGKAVSREAL